ncbi:MAG: mRNA surveillance protein pelota [Candidatus Micrarchaeota archaeon]|nr:mRNA surveillance protein pelota [Candidatus Micrarchaeota archaeon]
MRIGKQDTKEGSIVLIPENEEDLWHIERILQPSDKVIAKSFRRFKASEGDAGEKKQVTIKLAAEKIDFSKFSSRLRVTGKIESGTPEEFVQVGSYHTIDIEPGFPVTIIKEKWEPHHLSRIKQAVAESKRPRIGIVAMDENKAIYATLRGYGVEYELEIENSASKRSDDFEQKKASFFEKILSKLQNSPVSKIVVAGPGFGAENFIKFAKQKSPELSKKLVLEHCSYAERSGINELLRSGKISNIVSQERAAAELELMGKFAAEIRKDSGLAAYGIQQLKQAVSSSAVEVLMVTDELLRTNKEVAAIVQEAEKKGAKITVFSSQSDGGRELAGFGGFAALLRFRID